MNDTRIHIAEMAHIFAAGNSGPRARQKMTAEERGAYENLILLCPACHTMIDKAPMEFPDELICSWKTSHRSRIAAAFGAIAYDSRTSVRAAIEPILAENSEVHQSYGPDNDYRFNPESELADVWKRKVRAIVLPNNRKLLGILDANRHHLNSIEQSLLEQFRQHLDDLEARHIANSEVTAGRQFPAALKNILKDNWHDRWI